MAEETSPAAPKETRRRPLSRRKKILFLLVFIAIGAGLLELGLRGMWAARCDTPFTRPNYLFAFYPELKFPAAQSTRRGDKPYDVLLLGGSVLHHDTAHVDERLRELLTPRLRREVRIYNVATPGHTSLDSLIKYRALAEQHFDLVVFYHGINEARANNCPDEMFQDDYSHYSWYERIHDVRAHPAGSLWITPSSLCYLWMASKASLFQSRYVPLHRPKAEWMEHGADIKTAGPFERNLRGILELARDKGEPVLLMSFAYHLPAGYTYARFHSRKLDYAAPLHSVDIWGKPEHVVKAIETHNKIVVRLSREFQTPFVDQNGLMPKQGRCFNDICHLTHEGTRHFVGNMLKEYFGIQDAALK